MIRSTLSRLLVLLVIFSGVTQAQTILQTSTTAGSGYNARNTVTDGSGTIWTLSLIDGPSADRPLVLQKSLDGGTSWSTEPFTFNDATSGLSGTNLANVCAMCIDSTGTLHATWGRYYYPSFFAQYYRNYNPTTTISSTTVTVGSLTGAAVSSRTAALDILADASDIIYLVAHGPGNWFERLIRSTQPSAAGNTFTDLGQIMTTGSAQTSRIAIDANGLVHAVAYRSIGTGTLEHRIYTPGVGWAATTTVVGNTTAPNDYYGMLAADGLGNVHLLAAVDTLAGATNTWQFNYRIWNSTSGWSASSNLFSAAYAQYNGIANYFTYSIAADATTGKCSVVYRDLSAGGPLRLAERNLTDTAFTTLGDLRPPTNGAHAYYLPTIRGSLYPTFNRTHSTLDITWRENAAPGPYSYMFQRIGAPTGASVTLAAPPIVGSLVPFNCNSPTEPNMGFICGFAAGTSPGILLPDTRVVPLNNDWLLQFSLPPGNGIFINNMGVLDGSGFSQGFIAIPAIPSLTGVVMYASLVVLDPGASLGIGSISPALTITIL